MLIPGSRGRLEKPRPNSSSGTSIADWPRLTWKKFSPIPIVTSFVGVGAFFTS